MDKRPLRVGLVFLFAALALAAMLLTGCGGSDDRAKVEASLQQHLGSFNPEDLSFPIGAGPPRLQDKSCKDRHVTTKSGQGYEFHNAGRLLPSGTRAVVVRHHIQEQPHAASGRRCEGLRSRRGIPTGVPGCA